MAAKLSVIEVVLGSCGVVAVDERDEATMASASFLLLRPWPHNFDRLVIDCAASCEELQARAPGNACSPHVMTK